MKDPTFQPTMGSVFPFQPVQLGNILNNLQKSASIFLNAKRESSTLAGKRRFVWILWTARWASTSTRRARNARTAKNAPQDTTSQDGLKNAGRWYLAWKVNSSTRIWTSAQRFLLAKKIVTSRLKSACALPNQSVPTNSSSPTLTWFVKQNPFAIRHNMLTGKSKSVWSNLHVRMESISMSTLWSVKNIMSVQFNWCLTNGLESALSQIAHKTTTSPGKTMSALRCLSVEATNTSKSQHKIANRFQSARTGCSTSVGLKKSALMSQPAMKASISTRIARNVKIIGNAWRNSIFLLGMRNVDPLPLAWTVSTSTKFKMNAQKSQFALKKDTSA